MHTTAFYDHSLVIEVDIKAFDVCERQLIPRGRDTLSNSSSNIPVKPLRILVMSSTQDWQVISTANSVYGVVYVSFISLDARDSVKLPWIAFVEEWRAFWILLNPSLSRLQIPGRYTGWVQNCSATMVKFGPAWLLTGDFLTARPRFSLQSFIARSTGSCQAKSRPKQSLHSK